MAAKFDIPLIFWGEMPSEYGMGGKDSYKTKSYAEVGQDAEDAGHSLDFIGDTDLRDILLGGKPVGEYLDEGVPLIELKSYLPMDANLLAEKNITFQFLGYYKSWIPQEAYYYAVEHIDFEANPVRTEGTYSKYNSIDDKTDGFFYYTRWIKFGVGRAMMDSAQEIRNQHINKEEGQALISRYEGEYPERYEKEFLDYISLSREEFFDLCDEFRSPHLWKIEDDIWKLRYYP
jgi:hypothetical protein